MQASNEGFKMEQNGKIALIIVTLAIFTDILIYTMIVPILPTYASGLGASQQLIGLMFASYAIAFLIATPIVGMISDRFGRKMPMICGLAGLLFSTILFAYANDMTLLVIARSLQGISAAATWTAGFALLSDLFPAAKRQQVLGIALTGSFAGSLLGPSFGGFLYQLGGYRLPFFVAAGLVTIDGLMRIFLLKEPARRQTENKITLFSLVKNRNILIIAGVITVASGVSGMLEPTLPLYLQRHLLASPGSIGLLFAAATIGSLLCAPFAYKLSDMFGRRRVIVGGLIGSALALPVLVIPDSYLLEMAAMALIGGISSVMLSSVPLELTVIVENMGSDSYGSVSAIYNMALSLGMMFGPIAGGVLVGYLGISLGLAITAVGLIAYAAMLSIITRNKGTNKTGDVALPTTT